jgi:hypothetical protein
MRTENPRARVIVEVAVGEQMNPRREWLRFQRVAVGVYDVAGGAVGNEQIKRVIPCCRVRHDEL